MDYTTTLKNAGLKQTKQRLKILAALSDAYAPLTAEQIHTSLSDRTVSLSTVYRALELFAQNGITQKSNILDSDKFYYALCENRHRHYAICLSCRQMRYVDICPVHEPDIAGFTVTGHKLELYGYCDVCMRKNGGRS